MFSNTKKILLVFLLFLSNFIFANSLEKLCKKIVTKSYSKTFKLSTLKEYQALKKIPRYYDQLIHLSAGTSGYYALEVLKLLPFAEKNMEKVLLQGSRQKQQIAVVKVVIAKEKKHLKHLQHIAKKKGAQPLKMSLKNKKLVKALFTMLHKNILDDTTKGNLIKLLAHYQLPQLTPILEKKTAQKQRDVALLMAINACSYHDTYQNDQIKRNLFTQLKQAHKNIRKYAAQIKKSPRNRKYRSSLEQEKKVIATILGLPSMYEERDIVKYLIKSYELEEYLFSFVFTHQKNMVNKFQKNGHFISLKAKIKKEKKLWHVVDFGQRFLLKKIASNEFEVYKRDLTIQHTAVSVLLFIKNNRLKRHFKKVKSMLLDYLVHNEKSFMWKQIAEKTRKLLKNPHLKTISDFKAHVD